MQQNIMLDRETKLRLYQKYLVTATHWQDIEGLLDTAIVNQQMIARKIITELSSVANCTHAEKNQKMLEIINLLSSWAYPCFPSQRSDDF